jgi:ABC-type transport system involved in multi-copper enzyme maturation permease subunit
MNEIENRLEIKKSRIGFKRSVSQIKNTVTFEIKKDLKKTLYIVVFFGCIFLLFLLLQLLRENISGEPPVDAISYISSFLVSGFGLLIPISASAFGGSIIAADYQKQTKNLLFPKIGKERLLIGRIIANYTLNAIAICFYYALVIIATLLKLGNVPIIILASLGWALFYTFMLLSFVIFMSSVMKNTSYAIIISILLLLIVFGMIQQILTFTGILEYVEPLFIITYYSGIITWILDTSVDRFGPAGFGPLADYTSWNSPSVYGALWGILIYSTVLLIAAYFIFKKRH